jgi:hydrogenase/urease accessory protein HupE
MNRTRLAALAAGLSALSATPVLAHAGDHTHVGFVDTVVHFLTNPDHLLPLAAAAVVIVITLAKPAVVMRVVRSITQRRPK